jgi:hypothetical protein
MDDINLNYRTELERCEAIIKRNLNTFIEVGTALLEIRDNRLYRDTHKTFEAYCRERWGWNRDYANKQIRAAEVAGNLDTLVSKSAPTTERQLRPLARLEPEAQRHVWSMAVQESNGRAPTAAAVEQAKNQYRTETTKEIPSINAFKEKLAHEINAFLNFNDPLTERLKQLIKCKDDLHDFARLDLAKTLEVVAERLTAFAEQLYKKDEHRNESTRQTVESTTIH